MQKSDLKIIRIFFARSNEKTKGIAEKTNHLPLFALIILYDEALNEISFESRENLITSGISCEVDDTLVDEYFICILRDTAVSDFK